MSDFQTSKKKASSVFSSSDTFVPPLHARRRVPRDAQKAPAAPGQLRVHTHYLPPALTASRWHFTPITAHLPWLKPGGTEQGVRSPRELQQVCIQQPGCSFILQAGTGERCCSALPPGAPAWLVPPLPPLVTLISLLQGSISVFLLLFSICPRGYLFLPISGSPLHPCRGAGQTPPVFSPFTRHTHSQLPGAAALGYTPGSTSTPRGRELGTHESGQEGSIAMVSQLTIVSSLYFPQSQQEAPDSKPLLPTRDCCYLRANSGDTEGFPHPGHCRQHLPVQHGRGLESIATPFTE